MSFPDSAFALLENDDAEALELLLFQGPVFPMKLVFVDKLDNFGWSYLHYVVGRGARKSFDSLVHRVLRKYAVEKVGSEAGGAEGPLGEEAVNRKLLQYLQMLLLRASSDGEIPLHLAAQEGKADMIQHVEDSIQALSTAATSTTGATTTTTTPTTTPATSTTTSTTPATTPTSATTPTTTTATSPTPATTTTFTSTSSSQTSGLMQKQVSHRNHEGMTPFLVGVEHIGGKSMAHLGVLLRLGSDPSVRNEDGHDALQVAKLYTNRGPEIQALLEGAVVERAKRETLLEGGPQAGFGGKTKKQKC